LFLDVHEHSTFDPRVGIPTRQFWGDARWWRDIPENRHQMGRNVSFAEALVEHGCWQVPKVVVARFSAQSVSNDKLVDYRRVPSGIKQFNA
jgi:hypothetical protein